jgi:hypothetical protein
MTIARTAHDRTRSAARLERAAKPCAYGRPGNGSAGASWKRTPSVGLHTLRSRGAVGFGGGTSEDGTVRGP